ncbi:MAG: 2-C-methyl-D-erythritol 4-phosphate cytidylyltransferase [Cycloclasticus sp. symbiont of Poecilosclerida sp. N]|nr:MAG: 2-C-methyl-D-erythritol 4-phosphate cytidylyltransferase [Cycloclasticus sp. symbiont of Poecilosclerida sp. N]
MKNKAAKIWCVVPAAGVGSRFGEKRPKQYLPFRASTIIDVTIERLSACQEIEKIIVCTHPDDSFSSQSSYVDNPKVEVTAGGLKRADSVLNGIHFIKQQADDNDWVLVHDAVRPCVSLSDIEKLINTTLQTDVGGILAKPIHNTVKDVNGALVTKTLDRSSLWHALTPQIFKLVDLEKALLAAKKIDAIITDEASAIEQIGIKVQIVEGRSDNIKVTVPSDLALANFYINQQEQSECE